MTTWLQMQIACEIFARHQHLSDGYMDQKCSFLGEHDVIYSGVSLDDIPVDSVDGKRLSSCGWRPDNFGIYWCLNT